MRPARSAGVLIVLALAVIPQQEPADLIVEGRIFTADPERPWVEALAVRGERIVAAGTRAEVELLRGERTRMLSADPGVVVPGFNDAHGLDDDVELDSARTLEEIQARLRAHVGAHPEDGLVSGHGWNLARMQGDRYPSATMLDAAVDGRPVLL
jgi:hypothetical protein